MNMCAGTFARVGARGTLIWLSLALGVRAQDADLVPVIPPPPTLAAPPSVYLRSAAQSPLEAPPELLQPQLLPPHSEGIQSAPSAGAANNSVQTAPSAEALPPASELWVISTWRLPRGGQGGPTPPLTPDVYRAAGHGWVASSVDEFVATAHPAVGNVVFVHGNDTPYEGGAKGGTALYWQLFGSRAPLAPPTRFVVWCWANESTTIRVRMNARANAARANLEGYYLASFLNRLGPDASVSLLGYSSGASVVTGGLHVLAGGTLAGFRLPQGAPPGPRITSGVLLGAALPNDWLMPGQLHGRAVTQIERLVITVNPYDAVLHWYPLLWGRGGMPALGAAGLPGALARGPQQAKVVYVNVQGILGRNHGWEYYDGSPEVISLVREELLTLPAEVRAAGAAGTAQTR